MTRPTKSIDQRLLEAQQAIDNSLNNPAILQAVARMGYDQPRLQAARALYDEVMVLVAAQKREYGEQYEATGDLQAAWDAADLAYKRTLKICRIAFRDGTKAQNSLGLNGSRKKSLGGWIEQVTTFYVNLTGDTELVAALSTYGYDKAKLQGEAALVQAVVVARAAQNKERGEAQEVTQLRDAKLDELDQWLADYKAIAEIALAASPQQLEQLGWVVA
ncbi:MAG: hypothetical protein IPM39_05125 [Chloroflexi bacterium]|nr:hypothetical protein [Chloroflexota bacterium]